MKTVYTCFCTDVIHEGHLNIIREAQKYGRVIVGALSDEALIRYNRFPTLSLAERTKLYAALDGVDEVVVQNDMLYDKVLDTYKPDYVIHGDNWREGAESAIRENVLSALSSYGGELIEVAYTRTEQTKKLDRARRKHRHLRKPAHPKCLPRDAKHRDRDLTASPRQGSRRASDALWGHHSSD